MIDTVTDKATGIELHSIELLAKKGALWIKKKAFAWRVPLDAWVELGCFRCLRAVAFRCLGRPRRTLAHDAELRARAHLRAG